MTWAAEDRRPYAPAVQETVRAGMIVRLARTMDAIDPRPRVGRAQAGLVGPRHAPGALAPGWPAAAARGDACRAYSRPTRPSGAGSIAGGSWLAVLDRALAVVVACLRLARGRKRRPTAAVIDAQSVRTGPQRGRRGCDAGKKIKGRKRVLMIDAEGDPLGLRVVPADVHEHRALLAPAPDLAVHPTPLLIWLDRGFAGGDPEAFLNGHGVTVEVVGIKDREGFQLEKRRWKAEQTFGCLQRYRRLRVDDEMSCETSRGMAVLASLFMAGMRLERLIGS